MSTTAHDVQPRKVDIIHATSQPMSLPAPIKPSVWLCLGPALASSLLLWMCFFPVAWGWLGWVALVPLYVLVRSQATPRRIFWCAYAAGSAFFWPVLWWMAVNSHMIGAWSLLSIYCALYFPVAVGLIRFLDRKTFLPLMISAPVVWVGLEFVRSFLLTGFAWYYMGHTQHTMLPLIQIADLGGVYLVSFLVVAANAWLFELLYQSPRLRDALRLEEPDAPSGAMSAGSSRHWRFGVVYQAGALLLAFVCTAIYGVRRLEQNQFEQGPLLALLQTNLPQDLREEQGTVATRVKHYAALNKKAMDVFPAPDLIVWPETSYEDHWYETSTRLNLSDIPPLWRQHAVAMQQHLSRELVRFVPTHHLLGLSSYNLGDDLKVTRYNSALFVHKHGNIRGRYDKIHRVPFGEYVPLRGWVPFIEKIAPYDYDYSIEAGTKHTRFELDKHKFGVLICYEDTDPVLARQYARSDSDGPPVDFLINMSNDGWFGGSAEHEEHLAISRFRAIECRRALARSVNMGISAVIDGNGRVLKPNELPPPGEPHTWKIGEPAELPVAEWTKFKDSAGVILARIPLDTRTSFYAAKGDWFAGACMAVVLATAAWSVIERRRRRRLARAVS